MSDKKPEPKKLRTPSEVVEQLRQGISYRDVAWPDKFAKLLAPIIQKDRQQVAEGVRDAIINSIKIKIDGGYENIYDALNVVTEVDLSAIVGGNSDDQKGGGA